MFAPDDTMAGVINQQASVSTMFGMNAGGSRLSGYEGQTLPASTYAGNDSAAVPWSPDSPLFWLIGITALTVFGWLGASADLRFGKRHATVRVSDDA